MRSPSPSALIVAVTLLGVSLTTAGAKAVTPITEQELLQRHRPVLRYDSAETVFAQPASRTAEVIEADRVYGRIADQDGSRYLQYWLFFASNDQDRGVLRTGRHEGDWEFVQMRLGPEGAPDQVTFAQHSWAEVCDAAQVQLSGGAPVVYVARGSHASYAEARTADRPWPDPNDEADGEGREVRPEVALIEEGDPGWVRFEGRWGSSRAGFIPGEQPSPRGPMFQDDRRWQRPASYVQEVGRPCGETPPGRPWQAAVMVTVVAAAALGALWWRRRPT